MGIKTLLKDVFVSTSKEITEEQLPSELANSLKNIHSIEGNHEKRIRNATTEKKQRPNLKVEGPVTSRSNVAKQHIKGDEGLDR